MNLYLQYHNVANEGLLLSDPPFSRTQLCINTRLSGVQRAVGRVFLIAGIGRPRRYFLWQTFQIERIASYPGGEFEASGTGWQLAPPAELTGKQFERFRSECANFVGFRCISNLSFARTLNKLAEENRPPGESGRIVSFLNTMEHLLPPDDADRGTVRAVLSRYLPMRALSIRQPHAEAILRGVKKIEYRSAPTKIRGRVLIYASLGRYPPDREIELMTDYGITEVSCDELPRGVLVGSVDLFDCDGGNWHVKEPQRADKPAKPTRQPQPVWFYPF